MTAGKLLLAWIALLVVVTAWLTVLDLIAWLTPPARRTAKQRERLKEAAERWNNPPDCDP